jgi:hypothetical protein
MHIKSIVTLSLFACFIVNPHISVAMEKPDVEKISNTPPATQQPFVPQKPIPSAKKEEPKPIPIVPSVIEDPKTIQSLEEIHKLNTTKHLPISDKEFRKSVNKAIDDDASELTRQEGKTELTHVIAFNNIRCHYSTMKNDALSKRQWTRLGTFSVASMLSLLGVRQVSNPWSSKGKEGIAATPESVPVAIISQPAEDEPVKITDKKIVAIEKASSKWLIGAVETGISVLGGLVLGLILDEATQYINDESSKSRKIENETRPWRDQTARINKAMQALSPKDSENIVTEAKRLTTEYMKKYPTPPKLVRADDKNLYVIRDENSKNLTLTTLSQ